MNKPEPLLLTTVPPLYTGVWVSVAIALPPERMNVLVQVRGDNCPAFGWLRFGAGDRECPYFTVPQRAAMRPRGCHADSAFPGFEDVTHWFCSDPTGLPFSPQGYEQAEWGLGSAHWIHIKDGKQ